MRFLLILLCAFSCSKTPELPKQTLRINLASDPVSCDPRQVRTIKDLTLMKQLYEGLFRLDNNGTPQMAFAESMSLSDDLLTYTFTLKEAQWSDGSSITPEDFVCSWLEVMDPSFGSDYRQMLDCIENVYADDAKLTVQLKQPTPYFLELLAFPTFFPYKEGLYSGPFTLESWKLNDELILRKNPSYFDAMHVYLDTIHCSLITDNNTESCLFESHELDWLGQPTSHTITTELLEKYKNQGTLQSYPIAGTCWLRFNTKEGPFSHPKLRKAFAYAIDRQAIIEHILQGKQQIATGPLPPCMQLTNRPYFKDANTQLAQQLFVEAIAELGELPPLTFHHCPDERGKKIVQLIAALWEITFDVRIELVALERQLFNKAVGIGNYRVAMGQWVADFNDPLAFLELFSEENDPETGAGLNGTGWTNAQYNELLTQSRVERNPQKRRNLLYDAEKLLVEQMPIAPLYHYSWDYVKDPQVTDVLLSPLGIADFKSAYLR